MRSPRSLCGARAPAATSLPASTSGREILVPFLDGQAVEGVDRRIQLHHRSVEVALVAALLLLDGEAVLGEERTHEQRVADLEERSHQAPRHRDGSERHLESTVVIVEEEERSGRTAVDR